MGFRERLEEAAGRQGPTAIGDLLGISKQTVHRWMKGAEPSLETLFQVADKLNVDPRWLATGHGAKRPAAPQTSGLGPSEADLLARYRGSDPRWQLAIRLLSYVATEEQGEVAHDVNMVLARVFGKSPRDIKFISDERAAAAIGQAPHVAARQKSRSRT